MSWIGSDPRAPFRRRVPDQLQHFPGVIFPPPSLPPNPPPLAPRAGARRKDIVAGCCSLLHPRSLATTGPSISACALCIRHDNRAARGGELREMHEKPWRKNCLAAVFRLRAPCAFVMTNAQRDDAYGNISVTVPGFT
jgi:hypothetical protein